MGDMEVSECARAQDSEEGDGSVCGGGASAAAEGSAWRQRVQATAAALQQLGLQVWAVIRVGSRFQVVNPTLPCCSNWACRYGLL